MRLRVDGGGLAIEAQLDTEGSPKARDLYSAVKRGDITGMSFMFTVDKDSWEDIDTDTPKRTIMSVRKVFEVSAVAFPAYEGTDIQAASEGSTLDSVRASLESARRAAAEDRAEQARQERRTALLERLENLTKEVKQDEV
jgi:phage head maturation protease